MARVALVISANVVIILSLLSCTTALSLFSVCPVRCLCYYEHGSRVVICSNQNLEEYPDNINNATEQLDLSGNVLTNIPASLNHLEKLQFLSLARNRLTSLPQDLNNLQLLTRLDLSDNKIKDVASIFAISQLSSLKVLYLSRNALKTVTGLSSDSLHALDVSHCGIKEINKASLKSLYSLSTLSLAGNPLKSIQQLTSTQLKWLDLSDCLLNYLTPETFEGLPILEELRLANNPTLVFSTRNTTLRHSYLKRIDVSKCNLDRPGLHGLPNLTHARLSRNSIQILPDRIFTRNRELTHLYLNANGLEQLNVSTFEGLTKLEVLDLSSNGLEKVHRHALHDSVELKLVNLSKNFINEFPNLLSTVASLDLSNNFVHELRPDVLAQMPRIRSLNISDNRVETLPGGLESKTLRNLELKRNRLVKLGDDDLIQLRELQRLDLSGNRLTEGIDPQVFRKNRFLRTIKLEDNPWRCDCSQLLFTFSYLTEPPAKTMPSTLICQSPQNVSGYSWQTACFQVWKNPFRPNKDRTWGLVMVCLLIMVIAFGSVVSIRYTMRMKRQATQERQELERAEVRERLRLLRTRNQQFEDELMAGTASEPRIHPLELIGPPSYEEAVHMPRLVQSLDGLDEISMDNVQMTGSVDNLRAKKRRPRRSRKRTLSEESLHKRQVRHKRKGRDNGRRHSSSALGINNVQSNQEIQCTSESVVITPTTRRVPLHSGSEEHGESSGSRNRGRPPTPNLRKKKRRVSTCNGHSTDDEDSDNFVKKTDSDTIVIRDLHKEPRIRFPVENNNSQIQESEIKE